MKLPRRLSRTFLGQVGFTRAVRQAVHTPADPELLRLFQTIAPRVDWARFQGGTELYEPPRWIGYWKAQSIIWASDGILKVVVVSQEMMQALFRELQNTSFPGRSILPFEETEKHEPRHMLLHDTQQEELHVEPFEHAEAVLVNQPRGAAPRAPR